MMKRVPTILSATGFVALFLLTAGCDKLAVTAIGYVKSQAQQYSRCICKKDFGGAEQFHHPEFVWRKEDGTKLSGQKAIDGFITSLKDIAQMDTFYFYVHETEQKDDKTIVLGVTMQAHTIIDSMQMVYGNVVWKAKMVWVKTDIAEWKLANITEISPRDDSGSPPKDIKPL